MENGTNDVIDLFAISGLLIALSFVRNTCQDN